MNISNHARKRMKERCGFNKKSQQRMAERALEAGIAHKQTKGRLNKWVTSLYFQYKTANNIRIYGDNAYIFCRSVLVTVIPVPANLKKDLKAMTGEKNEKHLHKT